jgi:hypothetical protein
VKEFVPQHLEVQPDITISDVIGFPSDDNPTALLLRYRVRVLKPYIELGTFWTFVEYPDPPDKVYQLALADFLNSRVGVEFPFNHC